MGFIYMFQNISTHFSKPGRSMNNHDDCDRAVVLLRPTRCSPRGHLHESDAKHLRYFNAEMSAVVSELLVFALLDPKKFD